MRKQKSTSKKKSKPVADFKDLSRLRMPVANTDKQAVAIGCLQRIADALEAVNERYSRWDKLTKSGVVAILKDSPLPVKLKAEIISIIKKEMA